MKGEWFKAKIASKNDQWTKALQQVTRSKDQRRVMLYMHTQKNQLQFCSMFADRRKALSAVGLRFVAESLMSCWNTVVGGMQITSHVSRSSSGILSFCCIPCHHTQCNMMLQWCILGFHFGGRKSLFAVRVQVDTPRCRFRVPVEDDEVPIIL